MAFEQGVRLELVGSRWDAGGLERPLVLRLWLKPRWPLKRWSLRGVLLGEPKHGPLEVRGELRFNARVRSPWVSLDVHGVDGHGVRIFLAVESGQLDSGRSRPALSTLTGTLKHGEAVPKARVRLRHDTRRLLALPKVWGSGSLK